VATDIRCRVDGRVINETASVYMKSGPWQSIPLNIVNIHLPFVTELECALSVLLAERIGLVDFSILGKFTVRFHWWREKKIISD
jgi:hypothetical protein